MDGEDTRLVVASNRGPVSWSRADDELVAERGAGGLVTALGEAMVGGDDTWVSLALDDIDREVAAANEDGPFAVDTDRGLYRLRMIDVGERLEPHYNVVSNRLLWFTVHQLWGAPYEPSGLDWREAWFHGYASVNESIAETVIEEAGESSEIHLQDYHLMTAGPTIRSALPEVAMLHYVHTPWVGPEYLRMLPDPMVEGVLRGLLASDVVGFSAPDWSEAFRRCAADILGAQVQGETVVLDDKPTVVADFVLGVDPDVLEDAAQSDAVHAEGEVFDGKIDGRRFLLRADRTDLSKNILRGLLAYELLLERHPEHAGRVWHLAMVKPSRQGVPEYQQYLTACQDTADRIRERFGEHVLELDTGGEYEKVLAAMRRYDVLLTNPVIDGTNLVAKEGATLNQANGAIVLSRTAGATHVMGDAAMLVNPYDVEQQAEALDQALTMDANERKWRSEALREAAARGRPSEWLAAQRHRLAAAVTNR